MRFFSSLVVTMPGSSVREWLDHELEVRGIDAVVYTRYILSILQQDNHIHEPTERDFFPVGGGGGGGAGKKKENVVGNGKGKSKQKVNKTRVVDREELKKTAAVECLMSVTEQKCGIKELVEELCSRLKSIQIEANYTTQESVDKPVLYEKSCAITQYEEKNSSPEEQAEKYYAAFPSLSGNCDFDDIGDRASSEQQQIHTSVWDRKKILIDTTKETEEGCILNDAEGDVAAVTVVINSVEEEVADANDDIANTIVDCSTTDTICDSSSANVVKRFKPKVTTDVATKQPRHHHLIKLKHSPKLPNISSDRRPSFIVPKYKCRILKEKVQLRKERSPFNLFELTTKCLSSKRESADEKDNKFEDDVDSSFEDGESDEVVIARDKTLSQSVSVPSPPSEVHSTPEDVPLLKLEAKFNENLAAIWMELPIQNGNPTVYGEKRNNDIVSWIASLRQVNGGGDGFGHLFEMFDGRTREKESINGSGDSIEKHDIDTVSCNNDIEKRFVVNNTSYLSILDHLLNGSVSRDPNDCSESSSEETASLKNTEDMNRVWKCEGRVHGFIKGGVYGFEALESYWEDGDDCRDIETIAIDAGDAIDESCSPAFASSDGDAFLEWWKEKTCDSAELGEDLKLIWEVLGTIGDTQHATFDDGTFKKQSGVVEGHEDDLSSNVWEQLDHLDRWKIDEDLLSNFTWDYAFGLSENVVSSDCGPPRINVWSGLSNEMSSEKCKSMSSLIEEALRIQWKDEQDDSFCHSLLDVCGRCTGNSFDKNDSIRDDAGIVLNGLFPANTEDSLKMTRSYDSYLNRGSEGDEFKDNRLSKNQPDVSRHSDPNLFGKKCTLTYHKGESLFVEVPPRIGTGLLSIDDVGIGFLPDRFINVVGNGINIGDASKPTERISNEFGGENLLTSPMTHFRPIRQFSCESDETASSVGGDFEETVVGVSDDNLLDIPIEDKVPDHMKHSCQKTVDDTEDKPMFFEDENGILRLSDSNSDGVDNSGSRYMIYKSQDINREDAPAFVPKFKLRSDLEKFCQTEDPESFKNDIDILDGSSEDLKMTNAISGLQFRNSSILNSKIINELQEEDVTLKEVSCFNTCRLPFENETSRAWSTATVFSLENCQRAVGVEKSLSTKENVETYGIETLNFKEFIMPGTSSSWSVINCESSKVVVGGDRQSSVTSWPIVSSDYKKVSEDLSETYFWSVQDYDEEATESEELKSMKEEIKNEEDELFEDINQMRALDLHNEWVEENAIDDGLDWPFPSSKEIYREIAVDYHEDEDCPELELINSRGKREKVFEKWSHNVDNVCIEPDDDDEEEEDDVYGDDDNAVAGDDDNDKARNKHLSSACVDYQLFKVPEEENDILSNKFPSIPTSKVIYSSDLEEEWIRAGKPFDVQIPKINQSKTRIRCNRKPCSFFLDGTCRRTDCKFSHDLSSITCRFWEEGSCFKGITCPFLHGYPRISSPVAFVRNSSCCKEKNFKIESEADFPSLSKSVESTSSGGWIPSSFTAKRKKKRNRIRHHSTSIISKDDGIRKRIESDGS